ncbi:MAG: dephospho-CoA kinase [Pyrinomonadaceae bacterium]
MLKIGLTGSIAVGKSFVCECFRELGCHVLDADRTSREVVATDTEGLAEIVRHFGNEILLESGELDRKKLGSIVFVDSDKRELLNSIIHPRVIESQNLWIEKQEADDPHGIAIIDAALMIESGGYRRFDKLIVVWCNPDIQLKRLMLRDSLSENDARARIAAQMSQDEKKKFADHLIDTSDGFDTTKRSVEELYKTLKNSA